MTSHPLEYSSQHRGDPARLIRRLLAAVALLALCMWAIRVGLQQLIYLDRDRVHSALASVPGVRVVQINGFADGLGWTVADAEMSVDGSPTRTIRFRSPRQGELQSGSRMCVMSVGPYNVDVEVGDERVLVQHLDFGHNSEFKDVLPFQPTDVRELATRYDEIVAFVIQEPSGKYITREGKSCTYRIRAKK